MKRFFLIALLLLVPVRVHEQASLRTLTITTSEVTTPAIAATPDGRALVRLQAVLHGIPRAETQNQQIRIFAPGAS